MSAPALVVQRQGLGVISADNANTYEQTCDTIAELQAFIGIQGVQVYVRGFLAPGDGGQGPFYWNASYSGAGDSVNTIVPYGVIQGAWSRLGYDNTPPGYQYLVPVTGFSYTIPTAITTLLLNPAGVLATGSITLPVPWRDGIMVTVESTQTITSFSVSASGGSGLINPPTSLPGGVAVGFFYVQAISSWVTVAASLGVSSVTGSGSFVLANSPTITTPSIIGITNGSNVGAGFIGEFHTSGVITGVPMTSGVATNITSLTLTAGIWQIWAGFSTVAAGSTVQTGVEACVSLVSGTLDALGSDIQLISNVTQATGTGLTSFVGSTEINISATATFYLVGITSFTTSTLTAGGTLSARRVS